MLDITNSILYYVSSLFTTAYVYIECILYIYIYVAIECILYAYLLVVFCIKVTRYLTQASNTCGFIIYI